MTRLMNLLLVLFAFCVPWEYSLDFGEPWGNIARVLGLMILGVSVPAVLVRQRIRRPSVMVWLALAMYLYFACSFFWTVDPDATMEKIRAYFQVMAIVWLVWEFAASPEDLRGMIRAFVAGCWVLAILTIANYVSLGGAADEQIRFVAKGQDPNDVARFLDIGFGFSGLLFATERAWAQRLLAIGYVPAGLLAVLLTASRGGFSAAVTAVLGSVVLLVVWRPRMASIVLVGLAVIAGALWMFVPGGPLDRLSTIPEQLQSSDFNDRYNIWIAGFHAFAQRPWFGFGAGNYTAAARLATGDTAHNTVMAILVTGGLVAFAIFSAIVASVAWAVSRTNGLLRIALATTCVVWGVTSMVGSVEENRVTWLLFGLMALAGRLSEENPSAVSGIFSGEKTGNEVVEDVSLAHAFQ